MARKRPPRRRSAAPARPETSPKPSPRPRGRLAALGTSVLPAAASALLLMAAYPLPDQGWLAWFALVPWAVAVVRAKRDTVAWLTWPVWLVWWVLMLHWLRYSSGMGWIALCVYLSVYFPVAALLLRLLRRRFRLPMTLALPIVWVGLEYLRGRLLTGFPWFFLGHTQYRSLAVIQIADLAGAAGVTFAVAAVNGLIVDLLVEPIFRRRAAGAGSRVRRRTAVSLVGTAALVGGMVAYGYLRLAEGRHTISPGPTVAAIQGNIPQHIKHSGIHDDVVLDSHIRLTLAVKERPLDLVVWPETMAPGSINDSLLDPEQRETLPEVLQEYAARWHGYRNAIATLARTVDAPILVGNLATYDTQGGPGRFNSALLIDGENNQRDRYDKMHLVPFGEYVPLYDYFPWLRELTPYDYDYTVKPGTRATVFRVGESRFAVAICFESTIPQVVRQLVYDRASGKRVDFVANISNDGWFQASSELPQHLAICTFRAVENRVGIVRAVNTGISAFIDPNGRITQELRRDGRRRGVEGALVARVATDRRVTLYSRHGEWFAVLLTGLLTTAVIYHLGRTVLGRLRRRNERAAPKK